MIDLTNFSIKAKLDIFKKLFHEKNATTYYMDVYIYNTYIGTVLKTFHMVNIIQIIFCVVS